MCQLLWLQVRPGTASMKSSVNSDALKLNERVMPATFTVGDIDAIKNDKAKEAALVSDVLEAQVRTTDVTRLTSRILSSFHRCSCD